MKYLKIFEDFESSPEEGREVYSKYNDIINNNLRTITIIKRDEEFEVTPKLTLYGNENNLNDMKSRRFNIKLPITEMRDTIEFDLNENDSKVEISVYKPAGYSFGKDKIADVMDIFRKVQDYININDRTLENLEIAITSALCPYDKEVVDFVSKTMNV